MAPEELSNLRFGSIALRNFHHKGLDKFWRRIEIVAIQQQEDKCALQANTLVPIDEWMVAANVEQVRGRHLGQILVEKSIAKRGSRLGNRRLQEPKISNARVAPIAGDLCSMHRKHIVEA